VKATEEYLRPFIACHDPLPATRRYVETYKAFIMPIPFENIEVKIISPAVNRTRNRGETYQIIVAPLTNLKDHWYANFYPTSEDELEIEALQIARNGDIIGISGDIRKYPIGNAFGVVLDIFHAWSLDEDDEENPTIETKEENK
jgi:hypothetical protein